MNEVSLRLGPEARMCGVWTEAERDRDPELAVLLLNAGLLHKVGPYRMNVQLARRFATNGIGALRFDFGGLGDSPPTHPSLDYAERCEKDLTTAMDHLAEQGRRRFLVMGLCSGAINAHRAAVADERVAGIVALDGFAWPTRGFYLRHYAPRALSPARWLRFAQRKLPTLSEPPTEAERPMLFDEEFPPRLRIAADMRRLVARGCRMLYVFTGGVEEYLNYRGQFEDCFPNVDFEGHLEVEYFPEADHTYTSLAHRRRMFTRVDDWLARHF